MLKYLTLRTIEKNRALVLNEAEKITDLMRLLMKPRNSREPWTPEERKILRSHLFHLSWYFPALIVFCLPGGSLLLPLLAELLDRRKNIR